jgi:hypothetical protein
MCFREGMLIVVVCVVDCAVREDDRGEAEEG